MSRFVTFVLQKEMSECHKEKKIQIDWQNIEERESLNEVRNRKGKEKRVTEIAYIVDRVVVFDSRNEMPEKLEVKHDKHGKISSETENAGFGKVIKENAVGSIEPCF